jgi:hypothetical protein
MIATYYPVKKEGPATFCLQTMLKMHIKQQWFTLSYLFMEEARFFATLYQLAEETFCGVNALLTFLCKLLKVGNVFDFYQIATPDASNKKSSLNLRDAFKQEGRADELWHENLHFRGFRIWPSESRKSHLRQPG